MFIGVTEREAAICVSALGLRASGSSCIFMQSDEQSKDVKGSAGLGGVVGGGFLWKGRQTLRWDEVGEAFGGLGWTGTRQDAQVRVNRTGDKAERLGSCDRQRTRQIPLADVSECPGRRCREDGMDG